jgi:hypothetical protein
VSLPALVERRVDVGHETRDAWRDRVAYGRDVPADHRVDLALGHERVHAGGDPRGGPRRVDHAQAQRAAEHAAAGVDLLGGQVRAQLRGGSVDAGRAVQRYQQHDIDSVV